jgi:hypothetical protein
MVDQAQLRPFADRRAILQRPHRIGASQPAPDAALSFRRAKPNLAAKISYGMRIVPSYASQWIARGVPKGPIHLIFTLADHFEPAIVPRDGRERAPAHEQERRLERWCREYPRLANEWRDSDGRPFQHTYFYPAEQYDKGLIDRLAEHCHEGWGETEIHLHHGMDEPDTAENTRHMLNAFRYALQRRGCLSYLDGTGAARYAFVHGNFALANSAGGWLCGVDSEMQILAETGCYADLTLPTSLFHRSQTAKINSLYECALPLNQRAPQRKGSDLRVGREPRIFPLVVQGPLVLALGGRRGVQIENSALVASNPPSLRRLELWKRAAIAVKGREDWLFIKLHCHSMDPTHEQVVLGEAMRSFLRDLVSGAKQRGEILHFVSAREMVNIALAACAGREGNPGDYRDYRLKRVRENRSNEQHAGHSEALLKD